MTCLLEHPAASGERQRSLQQVFQGGNLSFWHQRYQTPFRMVKNCLPGGGPGYLLLWAEHCTLPHPN